MLNYVTTEEVIEKSYLVVAERLMLVPELKEAAVREAAGEKELVANKQDVGKTYQTCQPEMR